MTKHVPPPQGPADGGRIVDEPLSDALSRRYLAYALSTIVNRALPDVRDGLKPVQRRVLYAMSEMRLNPQAAARKCAKVVGDVMGGYHPHGDQSIYDALVRLAQDFAQRVPLVDGQGNFGNIDGDNPAAMRYTECRMTAAAMLLLAGIEEDAVDFRPTYDGQGDEPVVLPAAFPNLLANGASGITVGMATSIPPHNAGELIDACLLLLQRPACTTADLMQRAPGPDFPTGGIIVEPAASLLEAYETGRGGVRLRCRWTKEEGERGAYLIVITEIPYGVKKGALVEQLASLIELKKAPLLGDVRDESAEDVRLVLEPRARTVAPEVLMESLYRLCDLETRFPINLNVLDKSATPRVLGLKACLQAFLDHRRDVDARRARWRLGRIAQRLHILAGLLIVFLNLDEVIRIVRFEEEPKARLMATFGIDDIQADAILNTRLRQLAKLEEMELRKEQDGLEAEKAGLEALLGSDKLQWSKVADDLRATKKTLSLNANVFKRRSDLAEAPVIDATAALEAATPREAITVILSDRGWIRAAKGAVADPSELKFKEGDRLAFLIPAETTDRLILFASDGRAFTLPCDKLPGARGQGEPIRLMLELDDTTVITAVFPYRSGRKRFVASTAGYGFVVVEDELLSTRKAGKAVLNAEGGEALLCLEAAGDHLAILGDNGKALIFPLSDLPEMPRGKGVKLQSYREGGCKDALVFAEADGPVWSESGGRRRPWTEWREWVGKRASAGKLSPRGMKRLRG